MLRAVLLLLSSGDLTLASSACGEAISVTTQERIAEEQALRQAEQAVQ